VSIYDFNYKILPESHNRVLGTGLDLLIRWGSRRADRIITCSDNTRNDAVRFLGIEPDRIDTVSLGLGATTAQDLMPADAEPLRIRFQTGERKVALTLSDKRAHKNIIGLVEAAALIDRARRPIFIVAGYSTPHAREIQERISQLGLEDYFRLTDWVSEADREGLYRLADVFAFPSSYEGFGLPVLEAMARDLPVVCSNAASLPEVAGDAALAVNPHDHGGLAASIERVLFEEGLAASLRDAGRRQAARFTWAHTAEGTVASYERAIGLNGQSS
jgi:glycosyltransferase involved in cell wall biosynthesis